MKKYILFSLLLLQISLGFAQAPNKMSYQAVIRNSNNVVVSNHAVGMRISILQGTATGIAVYIETQFPTTNTNGLIAIEIGTGTVVSGSFTAINWANGPYFVKTETDPNGGNNYTLIGTSQLLSVPYALYAQKTDTAAVSKFALNGIPSGSQHGQTLTNCDGNITWTYNGQCPAKISAFNCADTVHSGTLNKAIAASGVSSSITYSGGNGGIYAAQSIASTGVLGLTAEIGTGNLNNGNGTFTFNIIGTPTSSGIAAFTFSIGNKTCTFYRTVNAAPIWPAGSVFCNGTPTAVVDVTNPITGKTWMDRNLGASRAATSSADADAYGDLYQWGRAADGHQCRNSGTTSTLSSTDQPGHGLFIVANDWRSQQNDNLWKGINGVNNPCPSGYRIPTNSEINEEQLSWTQNNNIGTLYLPLKLPLSSHRRSTDGSIPSGTGGFYWSSATNGTVWNLTFTTGSAVMQSNTRASGFAVRCIKDYQASLGTIDTIGSINNGQLNVGSSSTNVSTQLNYTNGNGAYYNSQSIASTGVTGLTASLDAGTLNNGNGIITFNISGTPTSSGIAAFTFSIGNKTCTFYRTVNAAPIWPAGTVFCNGTPTEVVEVTNPITGRKWMDRNLGAHRAATSSTDSLAYGDLYQWGRAADGHQCRNSGTTSSLSSTDQPGHGLFIICPDVPPAAWLTNINNNLWQGINGLNNPCPKGYRLPTDFELNSERLSWTQNNNYGAIMSSLKLPVPGVRLYINATVANTTVYGYYWSSSFNGNPIYLELNSSNANINTNYRGHGFSVRCIKD